MNQTELLDQFILEARECLEQIGQRLLDVEKSPSDTELLNDLFRLVHTLKGNCGLFEFKPLERVVHAGEDLLDRVRHGALTYHNDMADTMLEAMDFTAQMVDQIEQLGHIDPSADGRSEALASALRQHLNRPPTASQPAAKIPDELPPASPAPATLAPPWVARLNTAEHGAYAEGVAWCYEPEPECFFKGEDPWLLARQTPGLKWLRVETVNDWPPLDVADCYQCNLRLIGISDAPVAYLAEHFRCVPEQVQMWPLTTASVAAPASLATAPEPAPSAAAEPSDRPSPPLTLASSTAGDTLYRRACQIWTDQLNLLARPGVSMGTVQGVRSALHGLLEALEPSEGTPPAPGGSALTASSLALWAQQHHPSLRDAGAAGLPGSAVEMTTEQTAHPSAGTASGGSALDPTRRAGGDDGHARVLKVGQEKIDRLMDLIGEMVVAKNALPYLAQRAESHFQQRELAREIKAQYAVINRIAEDMQHAIMQVRMMPVGTIFQRFGRLVRDISRKLGKDVQLVIEGDDTEADKNVIESLADPLIHIIRNSLDHGIELPEVRTRAGKPAQGTIRVSARQESDRVIIEIVDDGAGVDPNRIRRKAIERGLIPEDKAQTLSDTDAVQLIFLPGFSTADTISDLSGRGVGMDVVRTAVERINGQVTLSSQFGRGTQLSLSLPLSMAVTNVMIIEAGGRRFGVPMDLIVETVRVHADDIHHFKQARTTVLRGRIVPLRALHDLLTLDEQPLLNEDGEHAVLVVRLGTENVGLLVDHFHGATDIILKPLEGVLSGLTGFAGTALMGDGSVLMILNPKELV